jgi:hypothetical protein
MVLRAASTQLRLFLQSEPIFAFGIELGHFVPKLPPLAAPPLFQISYPPEADFDQLVWAKLSL